MEQDDSSPGNGESNFDGEEVPQDSFPEWHVWNLKVAFSEFALPRLIAFREKWASNEMMAIPEWLIPEFLPYGSTEEKMVETWINILDTIIFSFDYQLNRQKFHAMGLEAVEERKRQGLLYFAKFFDHLWD